jgi:hypothetical protein
MSDLAGRGLIFYSQRIMISNDATAPGRVNQLTFKPGLLAVCLLYLVMAGIFASVNLDIDEFGFIREPYEMLGGDYTTGYLKQHRFADAASTALKSYYFYWTYRPLFSPLISKEDKSFFNTQERDFGYKKPDSVSKDDQQALSKYSGRLVVPEPDRFYSHGAGKPLLSAIVSIPQLALLNLFLPSGKSLLYYQYRYDYHAIFICARLIQLLAGLMTILIVYWILEREYDQTSALVGAASAGLFPTAIEYFPNLHHDSILAPLLVLAMYFFIKEHYKKAGLFLGVALATKNVAVFMLPVFAVQASINFMQGLHSSPDFKWKVAWERLAGPLKAALIGFLVLLPFANPISYINEILTPVTHRERDMRGENVEQFTLAGRLKTQGTQAVAEERPAVRFLRMLLRLDSNDFFFVAIAACVFFSTRQDPLMRMCFLFLLISLPYGLIFGYGLNYRSLQFVPFFALIVGKFCSRKFAIALVSLLVTVDIVYCFSPINVDGLHRQVNSDTVWRAPLGGR